MVADFGHIGVDVRPEVTQRNERICLRKILDHDTGNGGFGRDEYFILSHLAEANDAGTIDIHFANVAVALGHDEAGG